ncbi:MAG TPA: hypothetical protein VEP90_29770 [Methylomirabilota bacterium]|nr:hypothetical protein [Methylomirabilota bacterium]
MIVKIKDLLLWQWDKEMTVYWDEEELSYGIEDEKIVLELMTVWRKHGYRKCRCIPGISINRTEDDFLSPKAIKQMKEGKWMVWNGFHRIHAAIRLGKKTIRAEIY